MSRLDELDLTLKRKEQSLRLAAGGARLQQLRLTLGGLTGSGALGPPLLVVLEGWDASGKGGAIKRLVEPLDPRHARVVSYAAPTCPRPRGRSSRANPSTTPG
jgi:polyphosphate kinase 2 (PPK2 family)